MARLHVHKDASDVTWGYELYDEENNCIFSGDGYESSDVLVKDLSSLGHTIVSAIDNPIGVQIDSD